MRRFLVGGVAILFAIFFAALTLSVLSTTRVTPAGLMLIAIALFLAIVLLVGVAGSLRKPPRR
jgi:hypothetical protein